MNNSAALLRTLIIYAICVPLAIIVGYSLASLAEYQSMSGFAEFGVLALILILPILLRWHHPLLVFCWFLPVTIFFLPGKPAVYLPMLVVSLGISVMHRAISRRMHFLRAPQITLPLLFMIAVVLLTAKLRGGIGLHSLGSETMGGKKYVLLLAGILGFFALTAQQIPRERARLYAAFFLLAPCICILGDLFPILPSWCYFIYLFVSPDYYTMTGNGFGNFMRFGGVGGFGSTCYYFVLAWFGVRGIFLAGKQWRVAALLLFTALTFFGGFRGILLNCAMVFAILFYLEGMHKTKLLPILVGIGLLGAVICLPMANRMPLAVQRVLSFLPVKIDAGVRSDAQASVDWRIQLWKALLPQVPRYLLLGKGYAITQGDWELMGRDTAFHSIDPAEQGLAISGDYHNGPLSVLIPFGIWGAIGFIWFVFAGLWALNQNRLYGDPDLKTINNTLFAIYLTTTFCFFFVFGTFSGQMANFIGYLGLSISLNGGICRPARVPAATTAEAPAHFPPRPRFQPAFQRNR